MGFLKNAEELRQEGEIFLKDRDYTHALRSFEKAYEKGDHASLFKIYEVCLKTNQVTRGIELLTPHVDNPDFTVDERIRICSLLAQHESLKERYLQCAAALGHALSQNTLFQNACATNDLNAILSFGEQILGNSSASNEMKTSVLKQYVNRAKHEEPLGNNYYALVDGNLGKHTYLSLLHDAINCPPSDLRNAAIISFVRYCLLESYYHASTSDGEHYTEKYRNDCAQNRNIVPLLEEIHMHVDLARYYLALIYTFGFGLVDIDYSKASSFLMPLVAEDYRIERYAPGSQQLKLLLDCRAVSGLNIYISYRQNWGFNNSIIGNQAFKKEIISHLSILDRQFNQWDYTSNFIAFVNKSRTLDSNIWIFDGESSNAKKTLAKEYCRQLAYHCFMKSAFQVIDPFKINAYAMAEDKYGYIRKIVDEIKQWECSVLYFDNPYLVNETASGFDGLNSILRYLIHLMEEQKDRIIVLCLGGDGDRIKRHLISLGIADYKYGIIPFHGYSADEAISLLEMLNRQASTNGANIILDEQVLDKIHHFVSLKNNAGNRNINFDVITFIYSSLRNHYFASEGEDCVDYEDVFRNIEKELGVQQQEESDFQKTMEELDSMTGLMNIKAKMRSIIGSVRVNKMRIHNGLKPINSSLHMVFAGNPGTGKTTVAKKMGKILKELEVLSRGHVVEVSRSDLVDIYLGGTANKTRNVLNRALNGVLFIDEAYTLTNSTNTGGIKDYGVEAVEEILKFMSDHNDEICVIVAGYTKEMREFIAANPGLQSRFNTWVEFEDYSEDELYSIFEDLCRKNDFSVQEEAKALILADFKKAKAGGTNFGNARYVGTYFNELVEKLGNFLTMKYCHPESGMPSKQELQTFTLELFDGRADYSSDFAFADFFSH